MKKRNSTSFSQDRSLRYSFLKIFTKIATKVLKDGDLVEVDANKGVVKKLK